MLLFTNAQEQAINNARRAFNRSQTAMAGDLLVGNAMPVPIDAWRRIDARATRIQRDVLAVFNRLAAASSTPVGLGDIVSYFPKVSDSGSAHVSMDGRSEGSADQAVVSYEGTPIPIIDSYVRMGWRQMEVVRKGQTQLDVESIANAQRQVAEKLEDIVLNGLSSIVVGGSTIYGLRNHPQRNTGTHGFDLNSTATGANWVTAFNQVVNLLQGDNAFGRVTFFVNFSDYTYASQTEYTANYPRKIIEMLRAMEFVEDIVPCSKVPADNIIGINNLGSGEWGSMLNAMPMATRPKMRHNPEDDYVFGVMAAAAPQFRQDAAGRMQIAHTTAS